jgi:hypothetical protein
MVPHKRKGPTVLHACPGSAALRATFRLEVSRAARHSDGTVSLAGGRFEVPARCRHLSRLHLRYARRDLAAVDPVDARRGSVLCAPRNHSTITPTPAAAAALSPRNIARIVPAPATGLAPLLRQLMAEDAATGLPPPFIPTAQESRP